MRDETPILDAVLRPNPPASPRMLLVVLIIVASMNVAFGLSFILRGAWPILPFMGLDVALLAWAFHISKRDAQRYERVTLTHENLVILRHPAKGAAIEIALNPYWVRVDYDDPPKHWSRLLLKSHGKAVQIGSFLSPPARHDFAERLKSALHAARNPRFA
ncbi:MAG: DUF2244 domain-containing protein [Rhizomicrobium sp.]|jgi:uncharacterized membrane protein